MIFKESRDNFPYYNRIPFILFLEFLIAESQIIYEKFSVKIFIVRGRYVVYGTTLVVLPSTISYPLASHPYLPLLNTPPLLNTNM